MERMMEEIAEVEPLAVFERWLDEAWRGEPNAHAMTLATATPEGRPGRTCSLRTGPSVLAAGARQPENRSEFLPKVSRDTSRATGRTNTPWH